jgi:hypothetical protein
MMREVYGEEEEEDDDEKIKGEQKTCMTCTLMALEARTPSLVSYTVNNGCMNELVSPPHTYIHTYPPAGWPIPSGYLQYSLDTLLQVYVLLARISCVLMAIPRG